jgi:peptide deformylase
MVREILLWPDTTLQMRSAAVDDFGAPLQQLCDDLLDTCAGHNGAGLSAVQIGSLLRVFVVGYEVFVNPTVSTDGHAFPTREGCLSFPGVWELILRTPRVSVVYKDRFGREKTLEVNGLTAQAIQHENDHLDGITMPVHMDSFHRERFLRKYNIARRRATKA